MIATNQDEQTAADTEGLIARPSFSSKLQERGRSGCLQLVRNGRRLRPIETPVLYPVVNLITGSTPNGGGIWGYINDELLDATRTSEQLPLMTEALHFQNYHVHPNILKRWRSRPLREHYDRRNQAALGPRNHPDALSRRKAVAFAAPLFVDSGGFRLLRTSHLLIERYDLLRPGHEAESILALQADYGAELVASLDYPLLPNVIQDEADRRTRASTENAVTALKLLQPSNGSTFRPGFDPFFYVACHGLDEGAIEEHVRSTFRRLEQEGLSTDRIGIAIGSLVPLRSSRKLGQLARLIRSAISGVPELLRPSVPVHVFGVSGDLIPLLVYLGVDSFDSSTYVRQSYTMMYFAQDEHRYVPLLEQEGWTSLPCDCRHCQAVEWGELHATLGERADQAYRPQDTGRYKSQYYATVALHNLEMELRLLERTREALQADAMNALLVQHAREYPRFRQAVLELADEDERLTSQLSRVVYEAGWQRELERFPNQQPLPTLVPGSVEVSMPVFSVHSSEDFRVPSTYRPPNGKKILLEIPCSETKPYSASRSHRAILRRLTQNLDSAIVERIHKVTLSGLYGPVPEELEGEEAVLGYDFLLLSQDGAAIDEATRRLRRYLERYGDYYHLTVGYATAKAYRTVLDNVAKQVTGFTVYPSRTRSNRPRWSRIATEFYRTDNLEELTVALGAGELPDGEVAKWAATGSDSPPADGPASAR